jgi:hypothetical protein
MRYYFIYLKARFKHRKHIKGMIKNYLLSTGELMENRTKKLIKTDFSSKIHYQPKTKLTKQDMMAYLEGDEIDIDKIIKSKM